MRVIRGVGALAALAAALVGVPVLLVRIGAELAGDGLSWSSTLRALLRPDDGSVLVGVVLVVAWCAWAVLAAAVVAELLGALSGYRIRIRLPGLAGPQRLAAGLLVSVIALVSSPPLSSAAPAPHVAPVAHSRPADQVAPSVEHRAAPPAENPVRQPEQHALVHVVQPGDDLWSLAEQYYGTGRDWRRIAQANPDRLSGGPDRLQVGWRLRIPGVAPPADEDLGSTAVTVHEGDTLSGIAERTYGDADRWPEIYDANRSRLDDPDELRIGMTLELPARQAHHPPASTGPARENPSSPSADEPGTPARTGEPRPRPPAAPSTAPSSTAAPRTEDPATDAQADQGMATAVAAALATVGGLLAAGVIAGLAGRRRLQLQARPLGRRIVQPTAPAQVAEATLGRRTRPASLRTLDLATRAVAAACVAADADPPLLRYATISDDEVRLHWSAPTPAAPLGFTATGTTWRLRAEDVPYVRSVPGVADAPHPYPALVTLGLTDSGEPVVVDLEALGLLAVDAEDSEVRESVLLALAVELSFSPSADEMILTLVGSSDRLPAALGKHNVTATDDVEALLSRLESRAAEQRAQPLTGSPGRRRLDPNLADPWAPEIVLVNQSLLPEQYERLHALLTSTPRVTMAAVLAGSTPAPWTLAVRRSEDPTGAEPVARLEPMGLELTPQRIAAPAAEAVLDLVATTGSELTTPAPWWIPPEPEPPPDNVSYLGRRFGGWTTTDWEGEDADVDINTEAAAMAADAVHPILRILGPVDLVGATGQVPPRAGKQCLEYCGWLLEHPGSSAQAMAASLAVAEGTRRSNMSRLRSWLGTTAEGEPYLPDAYTGRIRFHPAVSSDWHRLEILTGRGVNVSGTTALRAALELVRGAPLADAAPGQWHWAEELRTDMVSAVRDIGVELAGRALDDNDIDLARWAASRALAAAPGDELLMVARIRTEHQAGNRPEVERLTLQLAAQARQLGIDLEPETVTVLQEVMEGRVRARLA